MTVSLEALPKGHEFAETRFELTREWLSAYAQAVEDATAVPSQNPGHSPVALAALSLRALLEQVELPPGTLHAGQELSSTPASDPYGTRVARARVASRGERQGWVLMGIELAVDDATGASLMTGRATITFPARKPNE
jgi:hypothetical protein